MNTGRLALLLVCLALVIGSTDAADWPQWRGPDRSNVSKETGLLKTWPKDGPPLEWIYSNCGVGYSGPAIVGERLYLMGGRDDADHVFALDISTKKVKELWAVKIGPLFTWKGNSWNAGPNATPTVDGKLVFALGGQGILVCVEADSGKEVWRKDLPKDLDAAVNPIGGGPDRLGWGFAWSPLVDGDHLICTPGGKQGLFAALDKKTGKVVWRSKEVTDEATYASPIVAEVGGVRQYIALTNAGLVGVSAADGSLLWYYKRKPPYEDVVIPTPIFHDNHVYATVGHGSGAAGCDLVKLTAQGKKIQAEKAYSFVGRKAAIRNQQGGVVRVGDHVYGSSLKAWVCQDFKTGKEVWEDSKLDIGSVTCADGQLYCFTERDGEVALVDASPAGFVEKGRFKLPQESKRRLPSGKYWTHPVVANGRLYLRDQELLFCYDVRAK
jgi:outer membrane protein assembly factor BamB